MDALWWLVSKCWLCWGGVCVCVCVCVSGGWGVGGSAKASTLQSPLMWEIQSSATSPNNPEPPLLTACPSGSCGPLS